MADQEHSAVSFKQWNLQGFRVVDVEIETVQGKPPRKLIHLVDERRWHLCPCGRRHVDALFECDERRFRDCSLGDFETYVVVRPRRLRCGKRTRVEVFPWAARGHRITQRFFERVAALCRKMSVSEVAALSGLSWDTVGRIDRESTEFALGGKQPFIGRLRWIGVDEVSRTGGHVYFTIVTDLETGRVVYVGDGKREESLAAFFEQLGKRALRKIRRVVTDLGGGFLNAIARHLPNVIHILDRFHVVSWLNEALNQIRRKAFGGAPRDELGRELKVKKWVLLKAGENLEPRHRPVLKRLRELNHPLYDAYLLKEQMREILHKRWRYMGALRRNILEWCAEAREAGVEFARVAKVLETHIDKLIAGFDAGVPLGLVEAINGKIALLRRQARGFRVIDWFKMKIFQRCSLPDDPYAVVIL